METSHAELGKDIAERRMITQETDAGLREAIKAFNMTWSA